jgi:hypothetical protein
MVTTWLGSPGKRNFGLQNWGEESVEQYPLIAMGWLSCHHVKQAFTKVCSCTVAETDLE